MIETMQLGKIFHPLAWPLSLGGRGPARPVRALHAVSLRVERGETFGLVGPNGAGKTTLLKVLATLVSPSEGTARVHGADILREGAAVRRAVGLSVGDERTFYWRLSGRENLEFFAGLRGLPGRAVRRRVAAVLDLVGLTDLADDVVGRYSTGMRQRLALARALVADAPVLLLDEPTRSLDLLAAGAVRALIRRIARDEGRTVLLATHDLAEVGAVCDRAAILVGGRVREILAPPALTGDGLAAHYRALLEEADAASPVAGAS